MSKKGLIVIAVLAVASFGASYLVSSLLRPAPPPQAPKDKSAQPAPVEVLTGSPPSRPGMKEQQLDDLIKTLRQKVAQFEAEELKHVELSHRMAMAQEMLRKDAQELEAMRVGLMSALAAVQESQRALKSMQIQVSSVERTNIKRTANILASNAENGGRIIQGMCDNRQEDEAVKILYYMNERAAANVLASVGDVALAARLAQKLKKVWEEG